MFVRNDHLVPLGIMDPTAEWMTDPGENLGEDESSSGFPCISGYFLFPIRCCDTGARAQNLADSLPSFPHFAHFFLQNPNVVFCQGL